MWRIWGGTLLQRCQRSEVRPRSSRLWVGRADFLMKCSRNPSAPEASHKSFIPSSRAALSMHYIHRNSAVHTWVRDVWGVIVVRAGGSGERDSCVYFLSLVFLSGKCISSTLENLMFKPPFCHSLSVGLGASHLISLGLRSPPVKWQL